MKLENYWLGISDVVVEGEWRTDKGDLQTYLNWASGADWAQPDNYNGAQHYGFTGGVFAPSGTWGDAESTAERYLLCTHIA